MRDIFFECAAWGVEISVKKIHAKSSPDCRLFANYFGWSWLKDKTFEFAPRVGVVRRVFV